MTLAYDYPLLGVFWTFAMLALWVAWILLLIHVIADIFRSPKHGGLAKAAWLLFVLFVPLIGVIAYTAASGGQIGQHEQHRPAYRRDTYQETGLN